ncbi:MAG: PA0069 family radical SAM protein [Myxococcota bacterium]
MSAPLRKPPSPRRPPSTARAKPSDGQGPRGRGASANPPGRFDRLHYAEPEEADAPPDAGPGPRTLFFSDPARRLIATNDSPDVGFDASINPYRGCEHGCIYCYARPTHEYLGFSAGLDFETRILVKERAPELLRAELSARRWKPQVLGVSGVTDAYQPIERRLRLTRRCLEVCAEFGNPVSIVTKNALVARDADVLSPMAEAGTAAVHVSITSLEGDLQRALEPRASHPAQRLRAVETLARAGVPTGVMVAPIIPGLNDHEIPAILEASARAGARFADYLIVRLPHGVLQLFDGWLASRLPERRDKVLNRLRSLRGGRLNDPRFGHRHRGEGPFAEQVRALFCTSARRHGLDADRPALSTAGFRRPEPREQGPQLPLFG